MGAGLGQSAQRPPRPIVVGHLPVDGLGLVAGLHVIGRIGLVGEPGGLVARDLPGLVVLLAGRVEGQPEDNDPEPEGVAAGRTRRPADRPGRQRHQGRDDRQVVAVEGDVAEQDEGQQLSHGEQGQESGRAGARAEPAPQRRANQQDQGCEEGGQLERQVERTREHRRFVPGQDRPVEAGGREDVAWEDARVWLRGGEDDGQQQRGEEQGRRPQEPAASGREETG